jgi:hypothetical protein
MEMPETEPTATKRPVWNAGRTVGAKRALKPKQIWEIRFYLNQRRRLLDRALFDLAVRRRLASPARPPVGAKGVIVTRWAQAGQIPTVNHPHPSTSAAEAERQRRMKEGTW